MVACGTGTIVTSNVLILIHWFLVTLLVTVYVPAVLNPKSISQVPAFIDKPAGAENSPASAGAVIIGVAFVPFEPQNDVEA